VFLYRLDVLAKVNRIKAQKKNTTSHTEYHESVTRENTNIIIMATLLKDRALKLWLQHPSINHCTDPGLTRSTQEESQFWLSDGLHYFRLGWVRRSGSRDAKVLCLIDVGAAWSRIKRRNQSQELTLQYKLVIPSSSTLSATSLILVVILFLYTQFSIITKQAEAD